MSQTLISLDEYLESIADKHGEPLDAASLPDDSVRIHPGVEYGSINGRSLLADIFTPSEQSAASAPVMVFVHGGGWSNGTRQQFHRHSAYLAWRHGITSVCVSYRLSGEAVFPAALLDVKCAVRWIRSQADEFDIDPSRIGVGGDSAGAHLAAMMAATTGCEDYEGSGGSDDFSSDVQLAVCYNPAIDLRQLIAREGVANECVSEFIGARLDQQPERYTEASPICRIHEGMPPVLLLHGTGDTTITHQQSVDFHEALQQAGVVSEIVLYEDKPHSWFNQPQDFKEALQRMEAFLVSHFGLT